MRPSKAALISALVLLFTLSQARAEKKKPAPTATERPSYELPQPAKETLDYQMYQQIREEAIAHSHVMEYASALMDGIGPRLTGSPNLKHANEWTREQLAAMGCSNAHLEDWGEFGIGWQQLNTWVRMTSPDTAVFIAQAGPWSPATNGTVSGPAVWADIKEEKDFDKYRGKLAGKIVFFGDMREVKPVDSPLFHRLDDNDLNKLKQYPLKHEDEEKRFREFLKKTELREKIGKFFASEHAIAAIVPSRDGRNGGGSGGTMFDDTGAAFGWYIYQRERTNPLPIAVMAIENYGRVYRLLKANVPVTLEMNIETKFTGDHEHGFNTVAEIPGSDPKLKDELVMLGGHLDSWASAEGATDNGAGTVVAMEVVRILNTLQVKPRRTIRVALWTGEEQGEFGSYNYVKQHFGYIPRSTAPDQMKVGEFDRKPAGPIQLLPDQQKISAYFNVDNGSGKIRGVYLQENDPVAPIFAQWIEPLKDLGVTTLTLRDTGGTDHEAFNAVGIPGFQFIQDDLDYVTRTHHSNMDTYERLQPEDLAQAALVEAMFVYNAAMRDQMLPRKPMPHPELEKQRTSPLKNLMPGAEVHEKSAKEKAEESTEPPQ
ncbi:MAG TPA: M20/M25/M40 family metallo-hydrolase [Terriglobales bacterium]|nr:M20/M25/M40 family metallo-hydrolase [Terriglobales bacterium]